MAQAKITYHINYRSCASAAMTAIAYRHTGKITMVSNIARTS